MYLLSMSSNRFNESQVFPRRTRTSHIATDTLRKGWAFEEIRYCAPPEKSRLRYARELVNAALNLLPLPFALVLEGNSPNANEFANQRNPL